MLAIIQIVLGTVALIIFGAVALAVVFRADPRDLPEIAPWLFPWRRR